MLARLCAQLCNLSFFKSSSFCCAWTVKVIWRHQTLNNDSVRFWGFIFFSFKKVQEPCCKGSEWGVKWWREIASQYLSPGNWLKVSRDFSLNFFFPTDSSFLWIPRPFCGSYNQLALFGTVNRKIILKWRGLCKTILNAHLLLLSTQSTWPSLGVVIDPVGQRLKIVAQVYLVNLN